MLLLEKLFGFTFLGHFLLFAYPKAKYTFIILFSTFVSNTNECKKYRCKNNKEV
jgi:hypothetical protein